MQLPITPFHLFKTFRYSNRYLSVKKEETIKAHHYSNDPYVIDIGVTISSYYSNDLQC
ncbi:MAG: hypothetical protein ABIQ31_01145 [Ferruginibacter sp.]